jgi:hypothetical protein
MKVNISYSVELEEVLENVQHLFLKTEETLRQHEEDYVRILRSKYTDENIGEVVKALDAYKQTIAKFDLKLGEMMNIMIAYHRLKYEPPVPQEPEFHQPEPEFHQPEAANPTSERLDEISIEEDVL